jgi:hypothetical protein
MGNCKLKIEKCKLQIGSGTGRGDAGDGRRRERGDEEKGKGKHVPEFNHVLGRVAEVCAFVDEAVYGCLY